MSGLYQDLLAGGRASGTGGGEGISEVGGIARIPRPIIIVSVTNHTCACPGA